MSSLFFRQQDPTEASTRTAASKLSNNTALLVNELAREPAQGLVHVAAHVQKSIPVLLEVQQHLEAAGVQLQAVLSELQDAQEGVLSITSPATQQDLAALAHSLHNAAEQLEQWQQQQGAGSSGPEAAVASSDGAASSIRLHRLFAVSTSAGAP